MATVHSRRRHWILRGEQTGYSPLHWLDLRTRPHLWGVSQELRWYGNYCTLPCRRNNTIHPLIYLAIAGHRAAHDRRRLEQDPNVVHERRAIPAAVVRRILSTGLKAPPSVTLFLRNASAVVICFIFFARGEAGAALDISYIEVTQDAISIAVALRKNRSRVANTLSYPRADSPLGGPVQLLQRYDSYRRQLSTKSRYYSSLPSASHRFKSSSGLITEFLQACLSCLHIFPSPQVRWTLHSLHIGAASECARFAFRFIPFGYGATGRPTPRRLRRTIWTLGSNQRRLPIFLRPPP